MLLIIMAVTTSLLLLLAAAQRQGQKTTMSSILLKIKQFDTIIEAVSVKYSIDADLIRAIIAVESGGNPWLNRYEPAQSQEKHITSPSAYASRIGIDAITEATNQRTSWGLAQIMGYTARNLGFNDCLTMLLIPDVNLEYMGMLLKQLHQRFDQESDVIAAYNDGSAKKTTGGMYVEQAYVNEVHMYLLEQRQIN